MKLRKTKKGYLLIEGNLSIQFTSYEYSTINDVYLYQNDVLTAIYSNREVFEKQFKRVAKGMTTNLTPLAYPVITKPKEIK